MIVPVRCYTCGKPIGAYWEDFKKRTDGGEDVKKVLDDMGITRYCCRRMLIAHTELIDEVMKFGQKGAVKKGPGK